MADNEGSMGSSNIANQTSNSASPNIGGTNKKSKIVKDVIAKGKTITGKTPDTIILNPVMEATDNSKAWVAFGRHQPFTKEGHGKVLSTLEGGAEKEGAQAHFITSHSEGSSKNPIPSKTKVKLIKKVAKPSTQVYSSSEEHPSLLHQLSKMHASGVKHITYVGGSDRVEPMTNMIKKYNGVKGPHGYFKFDTISSKSSGERDPDAQGAAGMSGTKVREHARSGNMKAFKSALPKELHPHAEEIASHIRSFKEDVDDVFGNFVFEAAIKEIGAIYDRVMEDNSKINYDETKFREDGSETVVTLSKHVTPGEPKSSRVVGKNTAPPPPKLNPVKETVDISFEEKFGKDKEAVMRSGQDRKKTDLVPRSGQDRKKTNDMFRQQSIVKKIIDEESNDVDDKFARDAYGNQAPKVKKLKNGQYHAINASGEHKIFSSKSEADKHASKEVKEEAVNSAGGGTVRGMGYNSGNPDGAGSDYVNQNIANADTRDNIMKGKVNDHLALHSSEKQSTKAVKESINSAGSGSIRGLGYVTGEPLIDDEVEDNYISGNIANADTQDNILKSLVKAHLAMHSSHKVKASVKEQYVAEQAGHYKAIDDLELNTKNRNQTIDEFRYGPINPNDIEGSDKFWQDKADMWETTLEAAKESRCKNCAAFNQSKQVLEKIASALGPEGDKISHMANLGFCEIFEFKCAGDRTCDAWLMNGPIKEQVNEDLRQWFKDKWVRMDTKGNIKGDCAREPGEGKPKCLPLAKARSMDKDDRATAARRKRREDPVADRPGKGSAPINVRTEQLNTTISEDYIEEKNTPTKPELWSRAKALARSKFDVYPSAYANGWAAKWYKSHGGGWKSSINEISIELVGRVNKARLEKPSKTPAAAKTLSTAVKNAWLKSKVGIKKEEFELEEATKVADRDSKGPFAIATKTRKGTLKRVPDTRFDTYDSAHKYGMQYHTDKYGSQMFHVVQHPDAKKRD